MKANELKVTELMIGDWVICYHPTRLKCFEKVSVGLLHTMQEQEYGHIKEDSPLFRIVEPIPITKELLEKNGFHLHNDMYANDFMVLHDDKKFIKTKNVWSVGVYVDKCHRMATCELTYLHELQQLLTLCKIDFDWKV